MTTTITSTDTTTITTEPRRSNPWFSNGAEYRERDGCIEARNNLNPDWVVVDTANARNRYQAPTPPALDPSNAAAYSPSEKVDTAPEQWRSQCLVARIQRDEALNLLRRIARKGEFMDMEGQRLVVSDWLARRHLSPENSK